MRVSFLAPDLGVPDGFYDVFSDILRVAAEQLDVDLEVVNCRKDPVRMVEHARELAARASRPDYVLVPSYRGAGHEILPVLDAAGIGVYFVVEGMTGGGRGPLGDPHRQYARWMGELVPDDIEAGYLLATELADAAQWAGRMPADGSLRVGILSGDDTPAGNARFRGWLNLKNERPELVQADFRYGAWDESAGREAATLMLEHTHDLAVLWCANDAMALGARQAVLDAGKRPGKDVLLGGIDLGIRALAGVVDGSLAVSVGGHLLDGARALLLLHDHHASQDLVPESRRTHLVAVTAGAAERYVRFLHDRSWKDVDFESYSRLRDPNADAATLSLEALVMRGDRG